MSFDPSRFAGVVVGLLLLAAGCSPPSEPNSLEELARRSLAQIGGELDVPGLREPVESSEMSGESRISTLRTTTTSSWRRGT